MSYVFCNKCSHRNPPTSSFCSACGAVLDVQEEHTITIAKVDPLQDALGPQDDVIVDLNQIADGRPILVVRSGDNEGDFFEIRHDVTRVGRHGDSDIVLEDITVSRRHCEILRSGNSFGVRDAGSLNGTYVNQVRVEQAPLTHGDEVQIGKFHLVFLEGVGDSK